MQSNIILYNNRLGSRNRSRRK